jgi:hypothetical protein
MSHTTAPLSRRALGAAVLLAAVVGCARNGSASAAPADPRPDPRPAGTLVTLRVSGGYAGVDRGVTVFEDGACTVRERRETRAGARLPREELRRLHGLLDAADLARQPSRTVDPRLRDQFLYRLRYRDVTVVTDLTGGNRPLQQAVHLLEDLMNRR